MGKSRKSNVELKKRLLRDFKISITEEMEQRMEELKSNDIALEHYVNKIIKSHLYKGEE